MLVVAGGGRVAIAGLLAREGRSDGQLVISLYRSRERGSATAVRSPLRATIGVHGESLRPPTAVSQG